MGVPGAGALIVSEMLKVGDRSCPLSCPLVLLPLLSSLDGYLYEQGPFHFDPTNTSNLVYNPYTWAKLANVIYLESPAGVGFSYSQTPSDYATNDTQTANDNFQFLVSFLAAYPEHAARDFYIAGESYAGVYIPTLAARVTAGNEAGESSINLKGIAVGNGCTGEGVGVCGSSSASMAIRKKFLASHGLVAESLSQAIDAACGDFVNPSANCLLLVAEATTAVGDVNIYDIYAPCVNGGAAEWSRAPSPLEEPVLRGPDACIDGIAAAAYLNTPTVIKVLPTLGM